jgi:hypothetical protein
MSNGGYYYGDINTIMEPVPLSSTAPSVQTTEGDIWSVDSYTNSNISPQIAPNSCEYFRREVSHIKLELTYRFSYADLIR